MLALKKLLYPDVQDICPNCGETCAITDALCPKCGKNLDELFEQLPNSEITHRPPWIARVLMNPQVIKAWNIANSVVLVASLLTPWYISFSDVIVSKIHLQYTFGFEILLFPAFVLISQQIYTDSSELFLFGLGLSLIGAIAPAIVIYYLVHGIRALLNKKRDENTPLLKFTPAFLRLLLAGISLVSIRVGVGFNSYVSLGYTLVIVGLLSAFLLEFVYLVLGYKHGKSKAA